MKHLLDSVVEPFDESGDEGFEMAPSSPFDWAEMDDFSIEVTDLIERDDEPTEHTSAPRQRTDLGFLFRLLR